MRTRGSDSDDSLEEAVRILRQLVDRYPGQIDYRFEFARTVTFALPHGIRRRGPREELSEAWQERVREAHTYAAELAEEHPTVPAYGFTFSRACLAMGGVLLGESKAVEAEPHFRQATEALSGLAAKFPSVLMYRMAFVRAGMSFADSLRQQNRLAEACAIVERGIEQTEQLPQRSDRPKANPMLLRQYLSLEEVYSEMGETEKAERISQEITKLREQFGSAGFQGRFPFDRKP